MSNRMQIVTLCVMACMLSTTVFGQEVESVGDSVVTHRSFYVGGDSIRIATEWTPSINFYYPHSALVLTMTWDDTLRVVAHVPMNEAARVFVDWIAEYYSLRIRELKDEVAFYKKQLEDKR